MVDERLAELRARRERLGIGREKLARLADVSAGTVYTVERGLIPTPETAEKIFHALDLAEQQASAAADVVA